jgi:hypothetical protein
MIRAGKFLSSLKVGERFTMPSSPFPELVYTKGRKKVGCDYYTIYWEWEGEKKSSIMRGWRYCIPVPAEAQEA